jgi:hypothetical protein
VCSAIPILNAHSTPPSRDAFLHLQELDVLLHLGETRAERADAPLDLDVVPDRSCPDCRRADRGQFSRNNHQRHSIRTAAASAVRKVIALERTWALPDRLRLFFTG